MSIRSLRALLALLPLACGPTAPPDTTDHRGEAGMYCKPDGTCIGPNLECVDSPIFLGLPTDARPSCRVKVKP
jgi:hypothetical protein